MKFNLSNVPGVLANQLSQGLNGNLELTRNLNAEVKTIQVTLPNEYPTWHYVGATGEPGFVNGFTNWFATENNAAFRRTPDGYLELRGIIKSPAIAPPTFTTIFTLPAGFLPPWTMRVPIAVNNTANILEVTAAGAITTGGGPVFLAGGWFTLDGLRFAITNPGSNEPFSGGDWPYKVQTKVRNGVAGVSVIGCRDLNPSLGGLSASAPVLGWAALDANEFAIRTVYGLAPGRRYELTLLILGQDAK